MLIELNNIVQVFSCFFFYFQGNPSIYKSVTAKAVEPSQVIRLPMYAFKEVFDENPDILISVIQVIMIRLHRVTFTALRNCLGLHSELVLARRKPGAGGSSNSSIGTGGGIRNSPKRPPTTLDPNFIHTLSFEKCDLTTTRPDMLADLAEHPLGSNANKRNSGNFDNDGPTIMSLAIDGFCRELGLKENERKLLDSNIEIKEAQPGITLLLEGNSDVSLPTI